MITFDERKISGFRVFPDQVEGKLQIDLDKEYRNIAVDLLSVKGQLLNRKQFVNTNKVGLGIGNYHPGFYMIRLNSEDWQDHFEVIITD